MNNLFYILITLVFLCLSLVYVKNTLHVFQQNRYEFYRYTEWLFDKNNVHYSNALVYVALMLLCFVVPKSIRLPLILLITVVFTYMVIKKEMKTEYVKPLVYTDRVKRQIVVYAILSFIITFLLTKILHNYLNLVGIISIYLPYLLSRNHHKSYRKCD